ncbi:MAG: tetratricopeptide repeat protein [Bacteroidales bacterium]|nr:tetratricopeptide repeat protein [Bacteroidales bacterium]
MRGIIKYISVIFLLLCLTVLAQAQSPKSLLENRVLTAVQKYDAGQVDDAIKMLLPIVELDPTNDAAYYYLAQSYIKKKEPDAAELYLQKAVELDRNNFWYRQRLATLYAATSRGELAISIYEQLLIDFPKKSDIYFELVELYAAMGEIDKALETIEEVEKVFGVTEALAVYRFNLLRMTERQEEAFKSLEAYNEKYSSPYVLSTLADWHISQYNDSTALAYYNEALDLDSSYAPAQLGKAEVLRMRRDYGGFFSMLNKLVRNEETAVGVKTDYLMAVVQRTEPKFLRTFSSELDTVMTGLISKHAKDSAALELAGLWYYKTSRNEEAARYFKINANEHPSSLNATAGYVEFLMYAEMWDDLASEGRKAFEVFPSEPAFLELASIGDYNMGRYDEVMELCDKVLEVAPRDSSRTLRAWSTKGDLYHNAGDFKKAYKAYDKALKINPDYEYVLNNYAYYLSVEGKKLKKAYEMSKKTIEKEPNNATYLDTFGWIVYLQGRPMEAKPFFKRAMLYGGKDSAVILDHYAEVLFALKEYDMAFVYWSLAKQKNSEGEVPDLDEKIQQKKQEAGR